MAVCTFILSVLCGPCVHSGNHCINEKTQITLHCGIAGWKRSAVLPTCLP